MRLISGRRGDAYRIMEELFDEKTEPVAVLAIMSGAFIDLYRAIVEHRRKFYHLGYVNYDLDYPPVIDFVPKGKTLEAFRRDYNDNMVNGYIYGTAIPFDALIRRIEELQLRFRNIVLE